MTADLYAMTAIVAFAVWYLSGCHLWRMWRQGDWRNRVFSAVLGIHLTSYAVWTNRGWFVFYRQLGAPEWMLDHWFVDHGLVVGLLGYALHAALYRPRDVWHAAGLIGLLVVGWVVIR